MNKQPLPKNIVSQQIINDEYSCGICHNVFEQPSRPAQCRHVFCKSCLFNQSVTNNSCPMCRRQFNFQQIIFEHQIRNKINSLHFECENCSQTLKLSNYNEHQQACNSVTTPKPMKDNNNNNSYSKRSSIQSSNASSLTSQVSLASAASASGRNYSTKNRHTFKCPYCTQNNLTLDSLRGHCNQMHALAEKNVVCPVCASMPWGDPNQKSIDFIGHLNWRHTFEYDNYVDYNASEEEMLETALSDSINQMMKMSISSF